MKSDCHGLIPEARRHSPTSTRRTPRLLDYSRVQRQLTELLGTEVDLAFEPLQNEWFRAHVERELVRAF